MNVWIIQFFDVDAMCWIDESGTPTSEVAARAAISAAPRDIAYRAINLQSGAVLKRARPV